MELIYGGQQEYDSTFVTTVPRIPVAAVVAAGDAVADAAAVVAAGDAFADADAVVATGDPPAVGSPQRKKSKLSSHPPKLKKKAPSPPRAASNNLKKRLVFQSQSARQQDEDADDVDDPFDDAFCEELEHYSYECVKCGKTLDWNSIDTATDSAICNECRTFTCFSCDKEFAWKDSYPKGESEWASDSAPALTLRCGECWERHIRDKYIPDAQEEEVNSKKSSKKKNRAGVVRLLTQRRATGYAR